MHVVCAAWPVHETLEFFLRLLEPERGLRSPVREKRSHQCLSFARLASQPARAAQETSVLVPIPLDVDNTVLVLFLRQMQHFHASSATLYLLCADGEDILCSVLHSGATLVVVHQSVLSVRVPQMRCRAV